MPIESVIIFDNERLSRSINWPLISVDNSTIVVEFPRSRILKPSGTSSGIESQNPHARILGMLSPSMSMPKSLAISEACSTGTATITLSHLQTSPSPSDSVVTRIPPCISSNPDTLLPRQMDDPSDKCSRSSGRGALGISASPSRRTNPSLAHSSTNLSIHLGTESRALAPR